MKESVMFLVENSDHNHTKSIEIIDMMFEFALLKSEKERNVKNLVNMYSLKRDLDMLVKNILFGNNEFYDAIVSHLIEFNHNYFEVFDYMYVAFLEYSSIQKVYICNISTAYQLKRFFDIFFEKIEFDVKKRYPKVKNK